MNKLKKNAWVEIEVQEGRKREVRRMFEALGYFVEKLIRIRIGSVALGALPQGELRPLTQSEIKSLRRAAGLERSYTTQKKGGFSAAPSLRFPNRRA